MTLDNFHNARILVVGDVMLDRYWWGSVNRISPEAPVPVVRLEKSTFAPGGAANVAVNVAGLGAKAHLLGIVGDDAEAGCLEKSLSDLDVSPEYLIRLAERQTSVKTRIVAHNQQVVRVDNEETTDMAASDCGKVCDAIDKVLPEIDLVIISDYAKGLLNKRVLTHLINAANYAGKKVLVDPKGKDYSKYAGATMITPNRREAAEACGLDDHIEGLVNIAGEKLLRDLNFEAVLITESENGMTLFQKGGQPVHFDAHAQEVYDVTGAGDTVIAALGTAVASGLNLVEASKLANLAAGFAVEKVGTAPVTIEMIKLR